MATGWANCAEVARGGGKCPFCSPLLMPMHYSYHTRSPWDQPRTLGHFTYRFYKLAVTVKFRPKSHTTMQTSTLWAHEIGVYLKSQTTLLLKRQIKTASANSGAWSCLGTMLPQGLWSLAQNITMRRPLIAQEGPCRFSNLTGRSCWSHSQFEPTESFCTVKPSNNYGYQNERHCTPVFLFKCSTKTHSSGSCCHHKKYCTMASAGVSSPTVGSVSTLSWCFTRLALPLRTALTKIATRSNTWLQILEHATTIFEVWQKDNINPTFFRYSAAVHPKEVLHLFLFFQLDELLLWPCQKPFTKKKKKRFTLARNTLQQAVQLFAECTAG